MRLLDVFKPTTSKDDTSKGVLTITTKGYSDSEDISDLGDDNFYLGDDDSKDDNFGELTRTRVKLQSCKAEIKKLKIQMMAAKDITDVEKEVEKKMEEIANLKEKIQVIHKNIELTEMVLLKQEEHKSEILDGQKELLSKQEESKSEILAKQDKIFEKQDDVKDEILKHQEELNAKLEAKLEAMEAKASIDLCVEYQKYFWLCILTLHRRLFSKPTWTIP